MIVDLILDRKDAMADGRFYYEPRTFYSSVSLYGQIGFGITSAMDYGEEADVKSALCEYIDENEYNPLIKEFIMSVDWLEPDNAPESKAKVRRSILSWFS